MPPKGLNKVSISLVLATRVRLRSVNRAECNDYIQEDVASCFRVTQGQKYCGF